MTSSTPRTGRAVVVVVVPVLLALLLASCAAIRGGRTSRQLLSPEGPRHKTATTPSSTIVRTGGLVEVTVPPGASPSRPEIHFFGDSITGGAAGALVTHFDTRYRVAIDAIGGATTGWLTTDIAVSAANPPAIAVIDLGTNDAACDHGSCNKYAKLIPRPDYDENTVNSQLDAFLHAFPASTCVIFVNVSTHNPSWGPANAARINAHLATMPRVVDWNDAWRPDLFLGIDNPHPNAAGDAELIELIDRSIATCPANTVSHSG